MCLSHRSSMIRNAAFSLLVCSKNTTQRFLVAVLNAIRAAIPSFYSETDARARSVFLSIMKRLCLRLQRTISRLRKSAAGITASTSDGAELPLNSDREEEEKSSLQNHVDFANWLFVFSCSELQPTASYQRHIASLKILDLMWKSGLLITSQVRLQTSCLL